MKLAFRFHPFSPRQARQGRAIIKTYPPFHDFTAIFKPARHLERGPGLEQPDIRTNEVPTQGERFAAGSN
jgi:hypothetical protein